MTLADGFRYWFVALFVIGLLSFAIMIARMRPHRDALEKSTGPVPSPAPIVLLGGALIILLTQVGEIEADLLLLQWIGAALTFSLADPVLLQVLFKLNAEIIDVTE
jgi:hypothetical protein